MKRLILLAVLLACTPNPAFGDAQSEFDDETERIVRGVDSKCDEMYSWDKVQLEDCHETQLNFLRQLAAKRKRLAEIKRDQAGKPWLKYQKQGAN